MLLFAFSGILAIWLGFFAFDKKTMTEFYKNSVYWFLTLNCFLFIISSVKFFCNSKYCNSQNIIGFFKYHWVALLLSLVFMILGSISCKQDFIVLSDETNLLSDSQSFYNLKQCFINCASLEFSNGKKDILTGIIDKRPAFFPYLVSLIHSLIGYRANNIFVLNFIVGYLSLFFIYYLIFLLFRSRLWGINGLICLAAYPLFIVYTNSAGFDVFNMMCSLVFFILLYYFIKNPDTIRAEALLMWVPLISQSRYESVLSVIIALAVIFYCLPKEEYNNLSTNFYIFPLLLVPPAWLRLITNDTTSMQVDSLDQCFSFENFCNNVQNAVYFFTSWNSDFGVIPILTILGVIGFVLFISNTYFKKEAFKVVNIDKNFNNISSFRIFWFSVFLFYTLISIVIFSFVWINFTEPIIRRQAIVFVPLIIIMTISCMIEIQKNINHFKIYFTIFSLFLLFIHWPYYFKSNEISYLEFKKSREFLEERYPQKKEYVIIHHRSNWYTALNYNSIDYSNYVLHKNIFLEQFSKKSFSFFIAIQIIDLETKEPYPACKIPEDFDSEIVYETYLQENSILRISKCCPKILKELK